MTLLRTASDPSMSEPAELVSEETIWSLRNLFSEMRSLMKRAAPEMVRDDFNTSSSLVSGINPRHCFEMYDIVEFKNCRCSCGASFDRSVRALQLEDKHAECTAATTRSAMLRTHRYFVDRL